MSKPRKTFEPFDPNVIHYKGEYMNVMAKEFVEKMRAAEAANAMDTVSESDANLWRITKERHRR
jgi:hypothetical protein